VTKGQVSTINKYLLKGEIPGQLNPWRNLVEKVSAKKIQNTLLLLPGTVATLMEIIANHLNVPQGARGGHHAL
jgi:hypothetical protein